MGRTVIADEGLWSYLKSFDHSNGFVVGLIIGQTSKTTDYVIHLARTPTPTSVDTKVEVGDPPGPSPIATITSVKDINESWIAEHALQVTRMLPGGMWVLGLFLIGSIDPFGSQADCSRFRSILRHIRTQLQCSSKLNGDSPSSEKLLLHINNQTKLVSCRAIDVDGGGSFLQATWKFHKDPVLWQQLECTLDLHQIFHLKDSDSSPPVERPLEALLDAVEDNVKNSLCTISGELRDSQELLENIEKKRKGKSVSRKSIKPQSDNWDPKILKADLFQPMLSNTYKEEAFICTERVRVTGSVAGRVFLNPKATVGDAVKAVKEDLVRSLSARVELHVDCLVEEQGAGDALHEPPRRVTLSLSTSPVTLSDYLFPGEGPGEALAASREVLDTEVRVSQDMETQSGPVLAEEPAACTSASPGPGPGPAPPARPLPMLLLVGVAVALCALLVALLQR